MGFSLMGDLGGPDRILGFGSGFGDPRRMRGPDLAMPSRNSFPHTEDREKPSVLPISVAPFPSANMRLAAAMFSAVYSALIVSPLLQSCGAPSRAGWDIRARCPI